MLEAPLKFLDDRMRLAAVGTFVITVLHERDSSGRRSLDVVALVHGDGKLSYVGL
jgi:hypothetical protein